MIKKDKNSCKRLLKGQRCYNSHTKIKRQGGIYA